MPGVFLERHLETICHRLGRVVGDDVACLEAAIGVVGLLGLGGVDIHLRCDGRERQAGARHHAAAPDRRNDRGQALDLLHQLARTGGLSGDDAQIVVGMDKLGRRFRDDLGKDRLTRGG